MKKVKETIIVGCIVLCMFSGCSAQQSQEVENSALNSGDFTPFLAESVSLELPDTVSTSSSWINGYILDGNQLIFYMSQADLEGYDGNSVQFYQRSYQVPLENLFSEEPWYQNHPIYVPEEVTEEISVPEELYYPQDGQAEYVQRFVRGMDGHIYYLAAVRTEENYSWTVYKCDADTGECVDKWSVEEVPASAAAQTVMENSLHEYHMQVDEADTLYLVDGEKAELYVIPREGHGQKSIELPERVTSDYLWNLEGQLQFIARDESGKGSVYCLDVKNSAIEKMTEVSRYDVQAQSTNEQGNVCYYTGTELFFIEKGEKITFLNYEKVIVKPEDLLEFQIVDDSVIYLNDCRKLIRHTKAGEHQRAEKTIITLGYAGALDSEWNQYVTGFNNSSRYYEMQLKEYDVENGPERLLADLSSGRGPDIFFTDIALVRELVKNGLIEDLTPYLEDGKGLETEHFVQSVLEANTYEKVLYTIPQNFAIDLLLGMEKNFQSVDNMKWSVSDYMRVVEHCGGMEILAGKYLADEEMWARQLIVLPVLEGNLDYYADEETGISRFAEEEFVELLQLAKGYQYRNFGNNGMDTKKKLLEGDLLLENWMITNVQAFLENRAILGNEEVYLTYPGVSREGGYGIMNYGSLSINAGSENKEGAWQFMQYVLNARGSRQSITGQYFASKEKSLTYQLECATVKQYQYDTNGIGYLCDKDGNPVERPLYSGESFGVSFEVYAATEADLQLLRELIEGISFSGDLRNDVIWGIATEEIGDMVTGVNDVDGTVHNLQTRVGLYLEERR